MDFTACNTARVLCLIYLLTGLVNKADCINKTLRKLNSKLNLIKTGFQREIDELKYKVLDLSTELDLARLRNDELESKLNETLERVCAGGDISVSKEVYSVQKLQGKIKQLDKELGEEKGQRVSLEKRVDLITNKYDEIKAYETSITAQQALINEMSGNLTNVARVTENLQNNIDFAAFSMNNIAKIRNSLTSFTRLVKSGFKAEKAYLRNFTQSLKRDNKLAEIVEKELVGLWMNTNASLASMENDVSELQTKVDEISKLTAGVEDDLNNKILSLTNNLTVLHSEFAQTVSKVAMNEEILDGFSKCCYEQTTADRTTQFPTSATVEPFGGLSAVTLEAGGPAILPLYEEGLAKAIKVGSRVVRGRDWAWGNQDGNPPGPGTVVGWYDSDTTSGQVYVKWDRGTRAAYRIGAHGKYDLYLLAEQTTTDTATLQPTSATVKHFGELIPVTLEPGASAILPLYGERLAKAIRIGSRVVRGRDWVWGYQDGNPPGPGTVEGWYASDSTSGEVYVKWDRGIRAKYRVGAHGKYDLYLFVGNVQFRLVNGTSTSGRLEVNYGGTWGTVCANRFDSNAAKVACRALNLPHEAVLPVSADIFGAGTGPIWFDELHCFGNEISIIQCQTKDAGDHDCSHNEDVGVICTRERNVQFRLVNGTSTSGRLEVNYGGTWGTVCANRFDSNAAKVACRALNQPHEAARPVSVGSFGAGTGPIWFDELHCFGNEISIIQCQTKAAGDHDCRHSEDVGVICTRETILEDNVAYRLAGGPNANAGRLEIRLAGIWGTVCDDYFRNYAAKLVCDALGVSYAEAVMLRGELYGPGRGPIWLDDVQCIGNETSILNCRHKPFGIGRCTHSHDVGVVCATASFGDNVAYRLAGGPSARAGRLEIRLAGIWGTVSYHNFNNYAAKLVCDALGVSYAEAIMQGGGAFGPGSGPIWLHDVTCSGNETSILDCRHVPFGTGYFSHGRDVGVICATAPLRANVAYRLAGGPSASAGRLEIRLAGIWGTVCDHLFNNYAAKIVCDNLGVSYAEAVMQSGGVYGPGSGPIWLHAVKCSGKETSILNCRDKSHSYAYCGHSDDVGVVCAKASLGANVAYRLAGGPSASEGRLEIRLAGIWGTVCDDNFSNYAAKLVCDALGVSYAEAVMQGGGVYGPGSGPIWLDDVKCNGNETSILNCLHRPFGDGHCRHSDDVGVICATAPIGADVAYRLVGGRSASAGRLEIRLAGIWGTVCDDNFNNYAAKLVCDALGVSYAEAVMQLRGEYGRGSGPIWLDDVTCNGNETSILNCRHRPFGTGNCGHHKDVGVVCATASIGADVAYRLSGGPSANAGRLEIRLAGVWGTVCDDNFNNYAAKLVCDALGVSYAEAVMQRGRVYGYGRGPIWLDDVTCSGNETSILNCRHRPFGTGNCGHYDDVGVICTTAPLGANVAYRLAGGPSASAGRLEIRLAGIWGTVCDRRFNNYAAKLVCDAIGVSYAEAVMQRGGTYGPGSGPIWLEDVRCSGNETSFLNCRHKPFGTGNCEHFEDVGVICTSASFGDNVAYRLAGGSSASEGRLEIRLAGIWGTVCDDNFNNYAAKLVCDALGVSYVEAVMQSGGAYGHGSGPIWLQDIKCSGNETSILNCRHGPFGTGECKHYEDVGVICTTASFRSNVAYRLAGGLSANAGRLEIRLAGIWGTVCDDNFNNYAAKLVCDALGVSYAEAVMRDGREYGRGSGPIWLDDVTCSGNETSILNCPHRPFGSGNCGHSEDVGVMCITDVTSLKDNGQLPCEWERDSIYTAVPRDYPECFAIPEMYRTLSEFPDNTCPCVL